jgi:hypothetical protein
VSNERNAGEATKGESVCWMFSHVFGHGLRLEVRCRTDEDVLACQEQWRPGLEAKGWQLGH